MNRREIALILVFLFLAIPASYFFYETHKFNKAYAEFEASEKKYFVEIQSTLDALSLEARSVSVFNMDTNKKIYSRNDTEVLPLASLSKIMTVSTALRENKPREITISREALKAPMDHGLRLGEKWNNYELAQFTLITSSNDGALALAGRDEVSFVEKMNERARRFGLKNTFFNNVTGLDVNNTDLAGAYGTAEEVNQMLYLAYLLHPAIFEVTSEASYELYSRSGFEHVVSNTNIATHKIPDLIVSKTGFTNLAGGNLAVIFKNKQGERLVVTILGSGFESRFLDIEKITNALYNISHEPIFSY